MVAAVAKVGVVSKRASAMAAIRNANMQKRGIVLRPDRQRVNRVEGQTDERERLENIARLAREEADKNPNSIEKQRQALEAERALSGQEEQRQPETRGGQIGDRLRGLFDKMTARIANVPDPGGLAFPLVTLFIFFMILIRINGHSRMEWLWLVLTGNAEIGGNVGGSSSGDFGEAQQQISSTFQEITPTARTGTGTRLLVFTGPEDFT